MKKVIKVSLVSDKGVVSESDKFSIDEETGLLKADYPGDSPVTIVAVEVTEQFMLPHPVDTSVGDTLQIMFKKP